MKKIITLLLILLFATKSTFSQSPNNIEKFVVVSVNDKDSILNKIKMSAPQFYNIGKGKRIAGFVANKRRNPYFSYTFFLAGVGII